jgi:biopolymer transport protein ExbB
MNLTQKFLAFTLLGAGWVLWVLVALSLVSVAIMIERAVFLSSARLPEEVLLDLRRRLDSGDIASAQRLLEGRGGIEARVAQDGLGQLPRGAGAVAEAMTGARTRERLQLERNLAILGTLGNNAPFIGLFGTVLGIIKAFHDLGQNQGGGAAVVMAGISEALVATAVGLIVAIPAVMAFNYFQRRVRARLARADELAHLILANVRKEA